MSIEIWPEFSPPLPEVAFRESGKPLFDKVRELDALAKQLGVRTLGSFGDNRPVPEGPRIIDPCKFWEGLKVLF